MVKKVHIDHCKFHPNAVAHVRCKTCGIPLCDECKMVSRIGVFCSEECHKKAKDFQERVQPVVHARGPSLFKKIAGVFFLLFLAVVILVILDVLNILSLPVISDITEALGLSNLMPE